MTGRRDNRGLSEQVLEEAAYSYLARFEASAARLRRVLWARVVRSARRDGIDPAPWQCVVDQLVYRFIQRGLVDDDRFAKGRVAALRRKGASRLAIRGKLARDGVPRDTGDAALEAEDTDDAEQMAALAYARRRRLGPFRPPETRDAWREKDRAALLRAGFAWEIAHGVLDLKTPDEP